VFWRFGLGVWRRCFGVGDCALLLCRSCCVLRRWFGVGVLRRCFGVGVLRFGVGVLAQVFRRRYQ
jgi:hypothetical protein